MLITVIFVVGMGLRWWDIITRMDSSTGCGDMIFSGHITFATLVCCAFVDYLPELGVSSFGRHIWTVLCTCELP